ncbi:MAG: anthranilate synthase component I [Gammaproteobacteria bacterium]|uniref:Anthranilate synthase component 1 n=1 Tax=Candidatus Thiopontia autotrophica TaxID=2841688 RepID=A0A8J6TXJ5_9GAMM|nr:anthranilate synthase component I [Candidatus Thiopontia autotrophica]
MNQSTFQDLADSSIQQGYNRIPLTREVMADLDTPLSAYRKVAEGPWSYLFESVQGGEKWGRYSIIGLPAKTVIRVNGHAITIETDGEDIKSLESSDPLSWIEEYRSRFKVAECDGLPRFTGGVVGCFGYDTVRLIEERLSDIPEADPLDNPDIILMVSEEVLVFDNLSGKLHIVIHVDPKQQNAWQQGQQRLDEIATKLNTPIPVMGEGLRRRVKEDDFVSGFSQDKFEHAVEKIKEYIVEGDVMQVVISQRLSIPFHAPPLNLYRALRTLNPSPYMYYLDLGDFHVVGSSPEILTRVEDGIVTVRPIAGTRRRGHNEEEDLVLEKELLADPKELAEHLMLIDLGRNDVGRVAETGTVELTENMKIERYSHVMHIVSNVTGKLKKGMSAMDALRATFPAGTVSGAPKIRAMEIIDELEPVKRGIYAGAVGYIGWNGNMDTAIAIRTAVIKNGELHVQAGAGVVHDSIPKLEWKETMNKGRAIFRAVEMAEAGLDNRESTC